MRVKSDDAEIFYDVIGKGPDVVLLHPFPANHDVWVPVAEALSTRYRLILPDLRGHGDSTAGDGPATMEKHAADLRRVLEDAGVGRAVFAGVSIGGYILFEFWRRERERFAGIVLSDTKAAADTDEARGARLKSAEDVERFGPEQFLEAQPARLLGRTTQRTRPDLTDRVRTMMRKMTVKGIALIQRGMAMRPDSTPILRTVDVPCLLMFGDEDELTTVAEAQHMERQIVNSRLQVITGAGHYAVFERHEDAALILRQWLDRLPRW
ncbi:MAG TPA: alpha/beta hydrolase [Terriglobales bacterium]|nr:alpha/beta hydrolase [Terriglobales bacterium]